MIDLDFSKPCFQKCGQQLERKLQICLQKFNEFPEKNFPGQGLVFKVALLTSFSMFSSNPLNLTLIFLVADSYLFYAPSTSLGQASKGTRFLLSRIEHFKSGNVNKRTSTFFICFERLRFSLIPILHSEQEHRHRVSRSNPKAML